MPNSVPVTDNKTSKVPNSRDQQLIQWLSSQGYRSAGAIKPMSGDAGFRRYFRMAEEDSEVIVVDSPPKFCNNEAFIDVGKRLAKQDIAVPEILAVDLEQGFFVLQDFGATLLADTLTPDTVLHRYRQALMLLPKLMSSEANEQLPLYDADFVRTELNIFSEWLCEHYLQLTLDDSDKFELEHCFNHLVANVEAQPKVFMHRDFHSRNLMVLDNDALGVIDFQDAVYGPVTYDAVSLLRDCYVKWPNSTVETLFGEFIPLAEKQLGLEYSIDTWKRWFDLMGIQRHVKAAGIFARLKLRDNKDGYINDIPLTLSYIVDIANRYPELTFLAQFVENRVIPAVEQKSI